jgi:hypothetical protein
MNHTSGRRSHICRALPVFAALVMSGCAELASIYRSEDLPQEGGHLVSIDAKQRVVLSNPSKAKAKANDTATLLRFCAEPPPDVFTALATSLGAEASFSQSATPEAAAKLAATLSENAATIERTQTVNILREAMYRNCERYLSGAISGEEFIVQAARDQQLIVQVLAVEQITGVARAQSTALTTVAKAAAGGLSDAGLQVLSEAKRDVEAKRAASTKAASEAAALPPPGPCGASPVDAVNPPNGVTTEQAQAKSDKCAEATNAAKLTREAESYFELVQQTVARQGAASSETQGKLATAAQDASEASVKIAEKVVDIVRQYQAFDEIGMTCVVKLRTEKEPPKYCEALLQQMADTRAAQLKLEEERLDTTRIKAFRTEMDDQTQTRADAVWKKLGVSFSEQSLDNLAGQAGITLADTHRKRLVDASADLPKFVKAFRRLPAAQQAALAKAAESP